MKLLIKIIGFILLITFLIFFLTKSVNLTKSFELIKKFPLPLFIALILLSTFLSVLKALRFHMLLSETIDTTFFQSLKIYLSGECLSPLPGGAVVRTLLIKKETGANYIKSSGPLVAIGFMEFTSALIVTIVGSIFFKIFLLPSIIIAALMIIVGYILINNKLLLFLIHKFNRFRLFKKNSKKITSSLFYLRESMVNKHHKPNNSFIRTLLIGVVSAIIGGFMISVISKEFGINLDILKATFVYTCGIVIASATGIIPGGLGTTEGGLTGILLISGVNFSSAVAIVLIFRALTLLLYFITGFFSLMIFYYKVIYKLL